MSKDQKRAEWFKKFLEKHFGEVIKADGELLWSSIREKLREEGIPDAVRPSTDARLAKWDRDAFRAHLRNWGWRFMNDEDTLRLSTHPSFQKDEEGIDESRRLQRIIASLLKVREDRILLHGAETDVSDLDLIIQTLQRKIG